MGNKVKARAFRFVKRLKYWIFKGDKQCHSCCVICEYYKDCSYEIGIIKNRNA